MGLRRERGVTVVSAARGLDVHENVLRRWLGVVSYALRSTNGIAVLIATEE